MAIVDPLFVIYIKEKQIKEILFCEPLQTTTKELMSSVLSVPAFWKHKLMLDICESICTDGALDMLGKIQDPLPL